MTVDTSREAVKALEQALLALTPEHYADNAGVSTRVGRLRVIAATLRALLAERDALREAEAKAAIRAHEAERVLKAALLDMPAQLAAARRAALEEAAGVCDARAEALHDDPDGAAIEAEACAAAIRARAKGGSDAV